MLPNAARTLARLESLLPLPARQAALDPPDRAFHRTILRALHADARAPDIEALARASGVADTRGALARLVAGDLVVIGPGSDVVGAYPITRERTPHRVETDGRELHAMCSIDALAIAPVFGGSARIRSVCRRSGRAVVVTQSDARLESEPAGALAGIEWREPGSCAAHSLCREMVFLASDEEARAWSAEAPNRDLLTLAEAVEVAVGFFGPLLP